MKKNNAATIKNRKKGRTASVECLVQHFTTMHEVKQEYMISLGRGAKRITDCAIMFDATTITQHLI